MKQYKKKYMIQNVPPPPIAKNTDYEAQSCVFPLSLRPYTISSPFFSLPLSIYLSYVTLVAFLPRFLIRYLNSHIDFILYYIILASMIIIDL